MNEITYKNKLSTIQIEQLNIFKSLEKNILFLDGSNLSGLVHFQNAFQTPIQRWYPYREGYSTDLVNYFIKELNISGTVFDPFVGSGTTLLSAKLNNLNAIGIDVNPVSVLVSRTETENYSINDIKNLTIEIINVKNLKQSNTLFSTRFELANKIFNEEILQSVLQLREYIFKIKNSKIKNLFYVAWLSIIEDVSNIKKEGNGIKYKNRRRTKTGYISIDKDQWEKQTFPDDKFQFVLNKLVEKLNNIHIDLTENYIQSNCTIKVIEGDCLKFDDYFKDEIQLTFFSPPYCNCFDYFEIHKVDLWIGNFIKNKDQFRLLRNTGFRSNTNSLNHKTINYTNEKLEGLISLMDNKKLWSKRIPNVIRGYFDDTHTLLKKLFKQTVKGGYVCIVVGNSAYTGVIIPTDTLIANIAKEIGFNIKNIYITRHLTTSSQQKKNLDILKMYLRESVIILEK